VKLKLLLTLIIYNVKTNLKCFVLIFLHISWTRSDQNDARTDGKSQGSKSSHLTLAGVNSVTAVHLTLSGVQL